jgi:coenzyme F420 hydrogenase subunit beta
MNKKIEVVNQQKKSELLTKDNDIALQAIIENELCSGCGACVGICPQGAISIDHPRSYKPFIQKSKCILCNLCYQVCPGKGWPAVAWATKLCNHTGTEMHPKFGPMKKVFLGRSTNPEIHLNAASGGVATSLLLYLLEINKVDAVAIVVLEQGYPVLKITKDPKEILSSSGSKYSPVPVMEHVIKKLKEDTGRIAMTAIPCHLAALHYAMEKDKRLAESPLFIIGLFCGDLKDYESVHRIADTLHLPFPQEAKFRGWRCGPWPGAARFELNDGSFIDKPLQPWLGISIPYYALHRCLMCPSRENWLADLSLADNHVGATSNTVIIVRSDKGNELLGHAMEAGFIDLTEVNEKQTHKIVTRTKFIPALSYIRWRKQKGRPVPFYDYDDDDIFSEYSWMFRYLRSLKYRLFILARKKWILTYLTAHPFLMEKIGRFLNRFPRSIWGPRTVIRFMKRLFIFMGKLRTMS